MSSRMIEQLKRHEGYREHSYKCTAGKQTIGYGFNIEAGISMQDAEALLQSQMASLWLECNREFNHWWWRLSRERQAVILNMAFNLGMGGLKKFKRMLSAIADSRDEDVVAEMLDSKWAHQVKGRAWELADQWRDNAWFTIPDPE